MTERISRDDVAHVARLARLHLDDEELERFTEQLGAVLEHGIEQGVHDRVRHGPDHVDERRR